MHWTRRVGLLCLCLLPVGWASPGSAQDAIINPGSDVVFLDDFSGSMALTEDGGTYMLFHKMIGEGVGFDSGFSRLGLRAKLWDNFDSHAFGEIHTLITDNSRIGFNVGGGYRWMYDSGIFGVHGWYDNYESITGNRYQQVTVGAEYLHPGLDLRTNVYVPLAERENFVRVVDPGTIVSFMQDTLVTTGVGRFERAFTGFDAEAGVPVPVIEWLRMYAGPYYLTHSRGGDTWGVRARAEAQVAEGVNLNFMVTEDNMFGTNLNLGVEIRFSGGMPTRFGRDYSALSRRYDQVRRNWPVQLQQQLDRVMVPLRVPRTDEPFRIIWVDNRVGPGGTGTFEDPLHMLPDRARDADLVLVRTGVGSTFGNIRMDPFQQLLGEGMTHFVETDRLGLIPLPAEFGRTGPFPTLESDRGAEPIITLADNTTVRAFNLEGINGIRGPGVNINNFTLEHLGGNLLNGIVIGDASGQGVIRNIDFTLAAGGTGIHVGNRSGAPLNLIMENIATRQGALGVVVDAAGQDINLNLRNMTGTAHTTAALTLAASDADLSASVTNVTASNNPGSGVVLDLDAATGRATFTNLQAHNNGVDGLRATADNGTVFGLEILDSRLTGNADDNLQVDVLNGSDLDLFVAPTALDNAGQNAFEFNVAGNSFLTGALIDGTMRGSGGSAIRGTVSSGSVALLLFEDLQADGSGLFGLRFDVAGTTQGPSTFNGVFNNVDFSDSGASNVRGHAAGGSIASVVFNDVTADNQAVDGGVFFSAGTGGRLFSNWNGGSISNTLGDGVRVESQGAASLIDMHFANVPITGNAGSGLWFDVSGGGRMFATASGPGNDFSNNAVSAFRGFVSGAGSRAVLSVDTALAENSGDAGALFITSNRGSLLFNYADGSLSNSGREGLFLLSESNSAATINLDNVAIDDNRQTGIDFRAFGGSDVILSALGGSVSRNGAAGAFSGVDGIIDGAGTTASVSFDGTAADNNTLHGYHFDVSNGATFIGELITSDENGTLSASDNAGNAVRFTAVGANTTAALLMTGPNEFNNSGAEGVFADGTGVGQFIVGLSGNVNNSGGDGVRINMDNVALGAVHLQGNRLNTINDNAGDGINITLADSLLNEINVETLTQTITAGGLVVDGFQVDGNAGAGIRITATDTVIAPGTSRITSVLANENRGGPGIHISMTDSRADGLTISDGGFQANAGSGIRLDLVRTPIDGLTIENNAIGEGIDLSAILFIDGQTSDSPFLLLNESGLGFDITRMRLNVSGTGTAWNTAGDDAPVPFQPLFNTDVETGLATVNGVAVIPGTDPLQDANGNVLPGGGVPDGSTAVDLTFNDFNPGEAFFWEIDASFLNDPSAPVFGSDLIGASVVVDFTGGIRLSGQLQAVAGAPEAAVFFGSQTGPSRDGVVANDGHGIVINADASNLSNLSIQGNVVEANLLSGITINADNGTDVSGAVSDNSIRQNGAHGLALNFNDSSLTNFFIERNVVDGNIGHGISLDFNNSPVTNLVIRDNPSVNENTGSGLDMQMASSHINGLLIENNGMGRIGPPPEPGNFTIDLDVLGTGQFVEHEGQFFDVIPMTAAQQAALRQAADRWEDVIIGNLPNVGAIDDILINVAILPQEFFDAVGAGGAAGVGGPRLLRQDSLLPFTGVTYLNESFLPLFDDVNFQDLVLHEYGHALGFGTIWESLGLVDGLGTNDPRFTGPLATAEHNALFGVNEAGVPLDQVAAHWRQNQYGPELMSPAIILGQQNVISRVTVAQWADLGYEVDMNQADQFSPATTSPGGGTGSVITAAHVVGCGCPSCTGVGVLPGPGHSSLAAVTVADDPLRYAGKVPALVTGSRSLRNLRAMNTNGLHGINIELDNSNLENAIVRGNLVSDHQNGDGIRVVHAGPQNGAIVQALFENNTVADSGGRGILVDLNNTGNLDLAFNGNQILRSGQEGIQVSVVNDAPVPPADNRISVNNNDIRESGGEGVAVTLRNLPMQNFTAAGNMIITTGQNGFVLDAENSSIRDIVFFDNSISTAMGGDGLRLQLTGSGAETLAIVDNEVGNTSVHGINVVLNNSPIGDVLIAGNSVGQFTDANGNDNGNGDGNVLAFQVLEDTLPVIRAGFDDNTLARNDDQSTGLVDIGFEIDFLGELFSQLFVNNNGNVTFDAPLFTFTPFDLLAADRAIIAPFFADVDTRSHGEPVTYGQGVVGGQAAFGVNYIDVDYFPSSTTHGDQLNSFQMVLIDRSDVAPGDFDIEFNYEQIRWETGGASGGQDGLGGNSARVGFSNGVDFAFELPGSAVNGAFLDDGPPATSLIQNSLNSQHDGRYVFFARSGAIIDDPDDPDVPDFVPGPTGATGIRLEAANGSNIGALAVDGNVVTNAGLHGIDLVISESTLPGADSSFTINDNEISSIGTGDGIRLVDPHTGNTPFELEISRNTISDVEVGNGVNIQLNENSGEMTLTMVGNEIRETGGMGLRLDMRGTAQADLTLGRTGEGTNVFEANTNAGVGISMRGDAGLSLAVENTVISGVTTDGTVAGFNGEGLHVRMTDNASMVDARIGDADVMNTSFTGNAGHGLAFNVDGFSRFIEPEIRNVSSTGNEGNGISFIRFGAGVVDDVLVRNSVFNGNSGDGVHIQARHASFLDEYSLVENDISGNGGRGIQVLTEADAQVRLDLMFNTIAGNQSHGIQTNAQENDITDLESFTGDWFGNLISSNGGHGIDINSPYGLIDNFPVPLNIGAIGVDPQGRSLGNQITGNGGNGIRIGVTGGFVNVVNNLIAENDNSGIQVNTANLGHNLFISQNDILSNGGHGIDLINNAHAFGSFFGRTINATIDDNLIRGNIGDGIQILSSGGNRGGVGTTVFNDQSFVNVAIVNGNEISFNGGRGIDTLVRGRGDANVFIDDAFVFRNGEEGVYSVVTSALGQDNDSPATDDLVVAETVGNQDPRFNTPTLIFNISNSEIISNGSPGGYNGGGLVFRVGTSGAEPTSGVNNSWRTQNTTNPAARGGLIASIDDNVVRDNFGVDVWMHTFTSTVDPATTAGTWDDDTFTITTFQQDPLARIRIDSFSGNTGGSVDLFGSQRSVNNNQNFAWYDNPEPEFKSRLNNLDDEPGPFQNANRRRNATRLPARTTFVTGTTLPPFTPIPRTGPGGGTSNDFLYPGVGESTLQVSAGSDLDLSNLFDTVITDFTSVIGIGGAASGIPFADTMYYWQTFP